jgi:hypothetical protein
MGRKCLLLAAVENIMMGVVKDIIEICYLLLFDSCLRVSTIAIFMGTSKDWKMAGNGNFRGIDSDPAFGTSSCGIDSDPAFVTYLCRKHVGQVINTIVIY